MHLGIQGEKIKAKAFNLTVLAISIFVLGFIITFALTPNYSIRTDYISDLSTGKYGIIFDISMMITGILLFPVYLVIYPILVNDLSKNARLFLKISTVFGELALINLVFIGAFPIPAEETRHNIVSTLFFILLMFHILFFSLTVIKTPDNSTYKKIHNPLFDWTGIGIVIANLIMIIISTLYQNNYITAIMQKIIVFTSFIYILYIVGKIQISHEKKAKEEAYWEEHYP